MFLGFLTSGKLTADFENTAAGNEVLIYYNLEGQWKRQANN